MYLPMLSDEELITHAEQTTDPIVTSDLERELIKRLQARVDLGDDERIAVLDEVDADDADDLKAMFDVLTEFNCDTPATLREKLERADKFYDIASDADDIFTRLADLAGAVA
jgi:hypothetical protein